MCENHMKINKTKIKIFLAKALNMTRFEGGGDKTLIAIRAKTMWAKKPHAILFG